VKNIANPKKESSYDEDEILDHRHEGPREKDGESYLENFHVCIIPRAEGVCKKKIKKISGVRCCPTNT